MASVSDANGLTQNAYNQILLVDDAIDTGNTIYAAREKLYEFFPCANVEIAAFSVFDASKDKIKAQYYLFENTIILGPWSNDSKEYPRFLEEYQDKKAKGVF